MAAQSTSEWIIMENNFPISGVNLQATKTLKASITVIKPGVFICLENPKFKNYDQPKKSNNVAPTSVLQP